MVAQRVSEQSPDAGALSVHLLPGAGAHVRPCTPPASGVGVALVSMVAPPASLDSLAARIYVIGLAARERRAALWAFISCQAWRTGCGGSQCSLVASWNFLRR